MSGGGLVVGRYPSLGMQGGGGVVVAKWELGGTPQKNNRATPRLFGE